MADRNLGSNETCGKRLTDQQDRLEAIVELVKVTSQLDALLTIAMECGAKRLEAHAHETVNSYLWAANDLATRARALAEAL